MVIKETPWETRNLGVESSVEFYFENNDENVSEFVTNTTAYRYQVAHVPTSRVDVVNELLANGFRFSETKIELTASLKELVLPSMFERFRDGLAYHSANNGEQQMIYEAMEAGVFSTDKVALDPHFDAHIAGQRYAHWTRDELEAGRGYAYIVTCSGRPIGFFVLKKVNERLGDSFLAALFD